MNIDVIFNLYKIKFKKLDDIIGNNCDINNNDKMRLFINIENILDTMVKFDTERYYRYYKEDKILELVSNFINLISHYRLFFSKNRLFSKIYLYIPYPFDIVFKNTNIYAEYREYYSYKYSKNIDLFSTVNILNKALPIVKTILEYIPNVYIIYSNNIEPSLIPMIVDEFEGDKYINFILTKDSYEYQYVNKDFNILRSKRDDSYIVTKNNIIQCLKQESNIKSNITIDSRYISFILSILGNRNRNIRKIKRVGLGSILRIIYQKLEDGTLTPNIYNINILSKLLKEDFREEVLNNHYCTDIMGQFDLLNYRDKLIITEQIKDLYDMESLKILNERYFGNHPVNLLELLSGDKFYRNNKIVNFKGGVS